MASIKEQISENTNLVEYAKELFGKPEREENGVIYYKTGLTVSADKFFNKNVGKNGVEGKTRADLAEYFKYTPFGLAG